MSCFSTSCVRSLVAFVASWLLIGPSMGASETYGPMGELEVNANYQGGDTFSVSVATAADCRQVCASDTQCRAMTYVVSMRQCWIKSRLAAFERNPDMISAAKLDLPQAPPAPGAPQMSLPYRGINYPGNDLYPRVTASEQECSAICLRDGDCRAATYVISQHTCWVKRRVAAQAGQASQDMVSFEKLNP